MCRTIFCDWPAETGQYPRTTLFELEDLTEYNLLFFDPLQFALSIHLRQNAADIWDAEYISFSERKFMRFLAAIKGAVDQIKGFTDNGGILIVRSNFPNSHIKVLKKSSSGTGTRYTESVTSAFFWMADFLDRPSFHYATEHSLRFHGRDQLCRAFANVPVRSLQSPILTGHECVSILADNGAYLHQPMITRFNYPPGTGQLYLIPYFLISDETEKLVETFTALYEEKEHGPYRPDWLDPFEKRLGMVNPYSRRLQHLHREMARLQRQMQKLQEKEDRIRQLAGLLYQSDEELRLAVKKAFRIIGFQLPDLPTPLAGAGLDFYLRDAAGTELVGLICAHREIPVPYAELLRLHEKLDCCRKDPKPKSLLIANAPYAFSPGRRPAAFDDDVLHENVVYGYGLIPSTALFDLACLVLEHWDHAQIEDVREAMQSDIAGCTGLFEVNLRKYLAAAALRTERPVEATK